ncbi:DNA repair protein RadC [Coprothermobacteraceae bacterium]|nr:DNA repair protein RadC [Coprothermobacteraceae bacterium]
MPRRLPIKLWHESERPRESLLTRGANSLSDAKLLSIVLRTGTKDESAEDLAIKLINTFGGLTGLYRADVRQLMAITGVGLAKAAQIKAALELGKRAVTEEAKSKARIRTPEDAVEYAMSYFAPILCLEPQEHFLVLLLDAKHRPIKHVELSRGDATQTVVSSRDVIREVSLASASAIIIAHNHPSGDPAPSAEDLAITQGLKEACKLVGTVLLDHVIIGRNSHISLAREGLL